MSWIKIFKSTTFNKVHLPLGQRSSVVVEF